jgi:hypothetical protein
MGFANVSKREFVLEGRPGPKAVNSLAPLLPTWTEVSCEKCDNMNCPIGACA